MSVRAGGSTTKKEAVLARAVKAGVTQASIEEGMTATVGVRSIRPYQPTTKLAISSSRATLQAFLEVTYGEEIGAAYLTPTGPPITIDILKAVASFISVSSRGNDGGPPAIATVTGRTRATLAALREDRGARTSKILCPEFDQLWPNIENDLVSKFKPRTAKEKNDACYGDIRLLAMAAFSPHARLFRTTRERNQFVFLINKTAISADRVGETVANEVHEQSEDHEITAQQYKVCFQSIYRRRGKLALSRTVRHVAYKSVFVSR